MSSTYNTYFYEMSLYDSTVFSKYIQLLKSVYVCTCARTRVYHSTYVEVTVQLVRVSSLSITWVQGTELRSSDLMTSVFYVVTHLISLILK